MNGIKVAVLFATIICSALAGTCTDICQRPCATALQVCSFVSGGNSLCTVNANICNTACGNVCTCNDQCEAQCQPDLETCLNANAANPVALAGCDATFVQCTALCMGSCAVSQEQAVIGAAIGQAQQLLNVA